MKLFCTCRRGFILQYFASSIAILNAATPALAMAVTPSTTTNTCAIVGVGVLGTSLCQQILESDKAKLQYVHITGITKSTNRHDEIRHQVLSADDGAPSRLHLTTSEQATNDETKFDSVVFCAPPSGFEDYAGAVRQAANELWNGKGTFVFTSSGGIYGKDLGETVTETTPVGDDETSPRVARLLQAERAALEVGGCVLRLAGLYDLTRGAHNYWLTKASEIAGGPDGIINLLHYEDAAGACLAALLADRKVVQGQVFLISDGNPLPRLGICESTMKAAVYRDKSMPKFAPSDGSKGKICDGSWSNAQLQWKPRYESFDKFMASHA